MIQVPVEMTLDLLDALNDALITVRVAQAFNQKQSHSFKRALKKERRYIVAQSWLTEQLNKRKKSSR